jgi:threonine/homoserine/homoserine lactone efflux protein
VSVVGAASLGVGLGVVTGMPLGVVNVAIVDAAAAGRRRFALGVGCGGASADVVHATLAFVGVGRLVMSRPELVRGLAIAAAVLIVGYAVVAWRRRPPGRPSSDDSSLARGFAAGFTLTLPNPGALVAWVAVASSLWPQASVVEAIALGIGVGLGSAVWFALLATYVSRVRPDHPALRYIPKVALIALVAIAAIGVIKTVAPA